MSGLDIRMSKIYLNITLSNMEKTNMSEEKYIQIQIEGFWSLLKRGFIGTYQYISKKHLQLYVDEFVFRYNTKMISEYDRFIHLLSNMCVRTRYNDLKIA